MKKKVVLIIMLLLMLSIIGLYLNFQAYSKTYGFVMVTNKWVENNKYFLSIKHICLNNETEFCSNEKTIRIGDKVNLLSSSPEKSNTLSAKETYDQIEQNGKYVFSYIFIEGRMWPLNMPNTLVEFKQYDK
ncbi:MULTISPECIES: hypothetical protein [Brevibacillus]|uniref:hypothetical protein n=1 Tax=Brevibacillus TaxID=55080 RepID=UPI000F0A7CA6|nr:MULTISPECIES: hypothetical protein [Brevibacillus]MDR7317043.1 uncharacterized protein YxeA [Brevibacillus nitrificans]MEC2129943.1 hypothetical protein [Brevibacillus centrosporus]MED1952841.1 hypothetical protein [Brevibacillus centrosporus]MED4907241.1 hypothetical protein [Brevibacillus centrosporus]RNB71872.1 hypothetical protein EDM55_07820 [Brevibacillus centrosporus]